MEEVDILHPLASFDWAECTPLPVHMRNPNCVLLQDKIYVGGGITRYGESNFSLFISSTDLNLWSQVTTPTRYYGLSTYLSQVVLVGGKERDTDMVTNKLWTLKGGMNWQPSLPPMPTSRYLSSALNTGSPECLVVSGGVVRSNALNIVEILKDNEWSSVQPLPKTCHCLKSILNKRRLYLMGGYEQGYSVFHCKLESLLNENYTREISHSIGLWSELKIHLEHSSPLSFANQLISTGGYRGAFSSEICAYSPHTLSWLHVGNLPIELSMTATIVLPTGELVVLGGFSSSNSNRVFKASLKVTPFNPESQFSMSALSRLEGVGIQVVTSLAKVHTELIQAAGITLEHRLVSDPAQAVEIVISQWESAGKSHLPPTWTSLFNVLKKLELKELSVQIEDYLSGKTKYLDAYRRILATQESIEILFVKMAFVGGPRLGKTTTRRRLTGEIIDIASAGEAEQPSTGAVESGRVIIRNLSCTTAMVTKTDWLAAENLTDEAHMFLQYFYQQIFQQKTSFNEEGVSDGSSIHDETPTQEGTELYNTNQPPEVTLSEKKSGLLSDPLPLMERLRGSNPLPSDMEEMADLFRNAMNAKNWSHMKQLFKDAALLNMEDAGGQPELMDMLPALTISPGLYLLFCKLIDDLQKSYTVSYLSPSGESTLPVESTYTVEEVLLSALSSIACFKSYSSQESTSDSKLDELLASSKSVAYIIGTHKDKVSEEEIDKFDEKLQRTIRSTDFFRDDLVQFSSQGRMVLPVDNMKGGADEIREIRTFLEKGLQKHFKKLRIPAAWLMLSLCLRKRDKRIASLQSCLQLAERLGMTAADTNTALWFLHHHAGVLMYFPNLPELRETVICNIQIIFDSVTNLIINAFKFGKMGMAASERFKETGQFSLEDIRRSIVGVSGDYIPLEQLVKLLEHLNIIAPITQSYPCSSSQTTSTKSSEVTYLMPCVLQNAKNEELDTFQGHDSNPLLSASVLIRYKCGFVPLGIFPAATANLVGYSSLTLIQRGIKKNRVQFRYGCDADVVTLISRPKHYEVRVTRLSSAKTPLHEVCVEVRKIIESSLQTVTSRTNYASCMEYNVSFKCPTHPEMDHLCIVKSMETSPHLMHCQLDMKDPQPVEMKEKHLVWFGEPMTGDGSGVNGPDPVLPSGPDYQSYLSHLPVDVRPHLERQLDWGHGGVDRDLNEIADQSLDWEEKLFVPLGLTATDISDIKKKEPALQRREALRRWKQRRGLAATYGNLLEVCVKAGHTQSAEAICKVLRKKYVVSAFKTSLSTSEASTSSHTHCSPSTDDKGHMRGPQSAPQSNKSWYWSRKCVCLMLMTLLSFSMFGLFLIFTGMPGPNGNFPPSLNKLSLSGKPKLFDLRHFPTCTGKAIDFASAMADYEKFVICLLEDDTGDKMKIIKKDKSTVVNVLNEVFIQWIKGKGLQPVLLQTFISCLEKADYHELIKDMKWSEKDCNRKSEL